MRDTAGTTRRSLLQGAAAGAIALAARPAAAAAGRACGWAAIPPPVTPRIPRTIVQLGRTRVDPYAWLKFVPAQGVRTLETIPAAVRDHLVAENGYADAVLAPLAAERQALLDAMLARTPLAAPEPGLGVGEWTYLVRTPSHGGRPQHIRQRVGLAPELLVDETERAAGHAYFRSTDYQPSPDNRYFAWAEDVIGNDRHRLMVRDNLTRTVRVIVEADAYGYGGLVFSPSSRWLFWTWRDAHNRPTRLYRTPVEGGAAELVYEEQDPALFMAVRRTAMDGYVALTLSGPETSEVRLIAAVAETAPGRVVWPRRPGIRYEIDEWRDRLVCLTDADGAFDQKAVALDREHFGVVDTLVPHRPGTPILAVLPFADALVRLERVGGLHRVAVLHPDGTDHAVSFPEAAYALELPAPQDYRGRSVTIVHQSPISPQRWIAIDLHSLARSVRQQVEVPNFDPRSYRLERTTARSPDGTMVPMTILSRRDSPPGKPGPVLLYGYGAYGISSDPDFSIPATVLVDRGWRYAIAHVRGGSERGRQWFLGGRKFSKRNSFIDFVACARELCRRGDTAPRRVVAFGLSAGGLLVAGAMNEAPELWGGVIAKVPFVDMLNTMSDADHPLVPLFRPDWGDPLADPRAYDYIASISPYENVTRKEYPPLLCTAGLKDDRVSYWEPAKLVVAVRDQSTGRNPALLMTDMHSGHQANADLQSDYREKALFWAFAQKCLCGAAE